MKLHFKKYGRGGTPLLILHGLLGSLDNWHTLAQKLSETGTVFTLDLRNHGHSPHSEVFTYEAMAADVLEFMDDQKIPSAVLLGHSMGGKVAMWVAGQHPERVKKLISADMGVKRYSGGHDEILDALREFPISQITSRKEADALLAQKISDPAVRQFLLKNLSRKREGGFTWRINLPVILQNYENLLLPLPDSLRFEKPVLFIRGERSPYIREDDFPHIRRHFPLAEIRTIPHAGHWLHAEAPTEFLKIVKEFLVS
ncbi:MAG: alpha/beta fold hydrolase [Calditrichaeota bacterium]|nr:alpha/beta fold hydrolase [Calditrichota bacterium]